MISSTFAWLQANTVDPLEAVQQGEETDLEKGKKVKKLQIWKSNWDCLFLGVIMKTFLHLICFRIQKKRRRGTRIRQAAVKHQISHRFYKKWFSKKAMFLNKNLMLGWLQVWTVITSYFTVLDNILQETGWTLLWIVSWMNTDRKVDFLISFW